jgi:hypothetical protein
MRRIRSAERGVRQATSPSPQGKLGNRNPKQGDPVKGMGSKANVASRHLHAQFETSTDAPSETSGSSYSDLMQALRGHFVTTPSSSTKKTIPNKQTPIALFQAILDSLKGAAEMVDVKEHPTPGIRIRRISPDSMAALRPRPTPPAHTPPYAQNDRSEVYGQAHFLCQPAHFCATSYGPQ